DRRATWKREWERLLGKVVAEGKPEVAIEGTESVGDSTVERGVVRSEAGIEVPFVLLRPKGEKKAPVVVGFAQQGKQVFLQKRSSAIAELLRGGAAVCLLDVRGAGETSPGKDRGRTSGATSHSATALMLGDPLLAGRLRDLHAVVAVLRERRDLDGTRLALW